MKMKNIACTLRNINERRRGRRNHLLWDCLAEDVTLDWVPKDTHQMLSSWRRVFQSAQAKSLTQVLPVGKWPRTYQDFPKETV